MPRSKMIFLFMVAIIIESAIVLGRPQIQITMQKSIDNHISNISSTLTEMVANTIKQSPSFGLMRDFFSKETKNSFVDAVAEGSKPLVQNYLRDVFLIMKKNVPNVNAKKGFDLIINNLLSKFERQVQEKGMAQFINI